MVTGHKGGVQGEGSSWVGHAGHPGPSRTPVWAVNSEQNTGDTARPVGQEACRRLWITQNSVKFCIPCKDKWEIRSVHRRERALWSHGQAWGVGLWYLCGPNSSMGPISGKYFWAMKAPRPLAETNSLWRSATWSQDINTIARNLIHFLLKKKTKQNTQKQHRHKALQIRNSKELNKAKTQTCKDFGHRSHQTLRYTIITVTQIKQKQGWDKKERKHIWKPSQ